MRLLLGSAGDRLVVVSLVSGCGRVLPRVPSSELVVPSVPLSR